MSEQEISDRVVALMIEGMNWSRARIAAHREAAAAQAAAWHASRAAE